MHGSRELQNVHLAIATDVDDLSIEAISLSYCSDAADGVGNVGEAASLQTVAMDRNHLVAKHCVDENGLRPSPPTQVLTGAIGAEDADDGCWNVLLLGHSQNQVLVKELRRRVSPTRDSRRAEHRVAILGKGKHRIL